MYLTDKYYILIPAYKPEQNMIPFLQELQTRMNNILVVDDGSGVEYEPIFRQVEALGIPYLRHAVNMGKGRALKTGINEILVQFPDCKGIVTADCDGQHTVKDIIRTLDALIEHPDNLIIGSRELGKTIPTRSLIGNTFMRYLYLMATGYKIHDTQTGLRGLPECLLKKLVSQKGERYEYEMNMLLNLKEWAVEPYEIKVDTIYINNNRGSHYNTLKDSIRIGYQIFLFLFSSLLSYVVEYAAYVFLLSSVFGLAEQYAYFISRAISSVMNYYINKHIVFKGIKVKHAMLKYYLLVLVMMVIGSQATKFLSPVFSAYLAKPIVDGVLFFVNFILQRDFIFKKRIKKNR